MSKYTVRHYAHSVTCSSISYSVDTPRAETIDFQETEFLPVRAWAFSSDGEPLCFIFSFNSEKLLPPNTERPDVNAEYSDASILCGLSVLVPFHTSFDIGVNKGGLNIWLARIELTEVQVLEGSSGYLFLDNDDNESVDQYTGTRKIDAENLDAWETYFQAINTRPDSSTSKFVFCIAPAKEYVFPDLYPVLNSGMTAYGQFKQAFSSVTNMLDPLKSLFHHRQLTYSKNDTHWTDFGAFITAQLICTRLKLPYVAPSLIYTPEVTTGDLGIKYNPQKLEYSFFADLTNSCIDRFDNMIPVRGNIVSLNNSQAARKETCLIFGSSSSESVAIQLCGVFSRVVRVFSGADIDIDIIEHEKPSCIIVILASRFLVRSATTDFRINSEVRRKLEGMTNEEIENIVSKSKNCISHNLDEMYVDMLK